MKSIALILEPIRRQIGQNDYFDILSQLERNIAEYRAAIDGYEAMLRDRAGEYDKLNEAMKYAKRDKDTAESFLSDVTNQRNKLELANKQLERELKELKNERAEEEHAEAYKAHLAKSTDVTTENPS